MPAPKAPHRFRPALVEALKGYRATDLRHDLVAGLVVGLIAITLSIPFAIASGAGADAPKVGLVTAIIAGGVAALAGGSRYLVTGPTGGFIVVLAGVVQRHGFDGLLLATALAGALLLLAGLFRVGQVIKFIPYPVTVGITAGIAVAILIGQLPSLLGTAPPGGGHPIEGLLVAARHVAQGAWDPWSLAVAIGTIVAIVLSGRFIPRVPGLVGGFFLAVILAVALKAPVPSIGDAYALPHGLPVPRVPTWSWTLARDVFPDAVTIAFLGALQTLLAALVADGMTRTRHDSNQELVAQGLANLVAPLFGGIAAAGAVARTATGIQNGARSPVSALVHVLVVLAALLLLAPLVGLVPIPVLGGLLAVVCWNMSQRHHLRRVLRMPRADAGVMLATLVLVVAVDISVAITVGMVLAVGFFLHRLSLMTHVGAVDPLQDPELQPARFTAADIPAGVLVYSIDGPFFFGAADQFQETIAEITGAPKVVILRMRNVPFLDATGLNGLLLAVEALRARGVKVLVSAIQQQPLEMLERAGVVHDVGQENLFPDTPRALEAARALVAKDSIPPSLGRA
jgi:sulfate permease, SulP family